MDKKVLLALLESFIRKIDHIKIIKQADNIESFVDFIVMQKLLREEWPNLYFTESMNFTPKMIANNFALLARAIMQTGVNYEKPIRKFYKKAIETIITSKTEFKPIDLIKILESSIKIISVHDAQFSKILNGFITFNLEKIDIGAINYQNRIKVIWLLGKLKYQYDGVISYFFDKGFINKLMERSPDELSKLINGLDQARYLDDVLLCRLITIIQSKIKSFTPPLLVNIAQSLAHIYINNDLSHDSDAYSLLRRLSVEIAAINPNKFSEAMTHQTLQFYYSLDEVDQSNLDKLKEYFPSWEEKLKTRTTESKFQKTLYDLLTTKYSLEAEFWIPEIASHVDAYEVERAVVFQVDGPYHHYINNNEYNSATIFNTKIIERCGKQVIRIDAKQVTDLAKDLVSADGSPLTLAQICSQTVVQEGIFAYVESLLPYKVVTQDESKAPEGFELSLSDQFTLGSIIGKYIVSPVSKYAEDYVHGKDKSKALVDYYTHIPESIASSSVNSLIFQGFQKLFPQLSLSNHILATNIFRTVLTGNEKDLLSPAYYQVLCKDQFQTFVIFALNIKYINSDHYGKNSFADGVVTSTMGAIVDLARIFMTSVYTQLTNSKNTEEYSDLDDYPKDYENYHGQANIMPGIEAAVLEL